MITQADIDRLPWYHDFDFPGGLKARSHVRDTVVFRRILWWFMAEQLRAIDFTGKSVIDVGCWDGYFSFLAEERGARRVLAVDDATQNWGVPESFQLAKALKNSQVELRPDVSVYEVSDIIEERFDIVMLFGVYYHLYAPFLGFAQIRSLCHEDSIVLIEGECIRDGDRSRAEIELTGQRTGKFIPTTRLLVDMLRAAYLDVEHMAYPNDLDVTQMLKVVEPSEVLLQIARVMKTRKRAAGASTSALSTTSERVLIFARPFTGANRHHVYRPPFGLERFAEPGAFTVPT